MSAGVADVATLGLAVNSDPIKAANDRLEQLAATSVKTEGATSKFMTATDALVAALNKNSAVTAINTTRMLEQSAASAKTATSLDKVQQATDAATSAATKLGAALVATSVAVTAQGKASEAAAAGATKHGAVVPKVVDNTKKHTDAANENTKAVGLNAGALQNLGFQINDVATMAAMGASGFQILSSQAGQIFQIAQTSGGGVKGLMTQAGEATAALASRIGLVGAGLGTLAIGFATAAVAASTYRNEQRELERSTFGVGRASGATLDDLQRSADEAASSGRITSSRARSVVGDLNSTGRIDPAFYSTVAKNMEDVSKLMGKELPEATDFLTSALAGGTQGFDRLNAELGLGGDAMRKQVDDAYKVGNAYGAQMIIISALTERMKEFKKETGEPGYFERVFKAINRGFGENTSDEMSAIGKPFGRSTPQDNLSRARGAVSNLQAQVDAGLGSPQALAAAQAQVEKIEASIAKSAADAKVAKTNLTSLTVGPLVDSLNPAQKRIEDIQKLAKQIEEYLTNGGDKLDKDGTARRTMDGLNLQAAQLTSELGKGGAALSAGLERAQFALKTVGYSDYARGRAGIIESDRVAREGITASNQDPAAREAALKTQSDLLATQLKTFDEQIKLASQAQVANGGGRYSTTVAQAPQQYQQMILDNAAKYGQDPDLMASMLRRESRFNPNAVSPRGARGIAQFMPDTATEYGVNVNDPASSIEGMAKYLQKASAKFGGNVPDMVASYNRGMGGQERWIANGRNPATMPAETRGYMGEILTPGTGTTESNRELVERQRQLKLEADITKATTEAGGRDSDGLRARIEVLTQASAAEARGQEISKEGIALLKAEADARSKLAAEQRMAAYTVQGQWDRDQLGRTSGDQRAFAQARAITNSTDMGTKEAQQVIAETRANQGLLETKNMVSESLNSLASDLRRGATAAQAFGNVLNRIGDKALGNVIDSLVSGAFGSGGGSGGGGLGGMLGGIGKLFGFANGGIMTPYGQVPLKTYSKGGVASSPQAAIFGEGDMNEAYVPLPDGKRIPVAMARGPEAANTNYGGAVTFAPQYNFPSQVDGMTPGQVAAFIDRKNADLVRQLPGLVRDQQRRRA